MTESMHYSGELVNNLMEVTIPALKYTVYHPEDAEKATEGEFFRKVESRSSACLCRS